MYISYFLLEKCFITFFCEGNENALIGSALSLSYTTNSRLWPFWLLPNTEWQPNFLISSSKVVIRFFQNQRVTKINKAFNNGVRFMMNMSNFLLCNFWIACKVNPWTKHSIFTFLKDFTIHDFIGWFFTCGMVIFSFANIAYEPITGELLFPASLMGSELNPPMRSNGSLKTAGHVVNTKGHHSVRLLIF